MTEVYIDGIFVGTVEDAVGFVKQVREERRQGTVLPELNVSYDKKADLVDDLFSKIGLNKTEADKFLDALFEELTGALENGEEVGIMNFGKFSLRDKTSRPGIDFKTKKLVMIEPKRVVSFNASQMLKKSVASTEL